MWEVPVATHGVRMPGWICMCQRALQGDECGFPFVPVLAILRHCGQAVTKLTLSLRLTNTSQFEGPLGKGKQKTHASPVVLVLLTDKLFPECVLIYCLCQGGEKGAGQEVGHIFMFGEGCSLWGWAVGYL